MFGYNQQLINVLKPIYLREKEGARGDPKAKINQYIIISTTAPSDRKKEKNKRSSLNKNTNPGFITLMLHEI
jgi:hypothetical protein